MTARRDLPDLDPSFRVRDALAGGVARSRLRARDLHAAHRGVRSRCNDARSALVPLLRRDQAFSGPTAAGILGIPLPARWRDDPSLHVVSLAGDRMRRPGVVGTRSSIGRIIVAEGLPVLDPVSTWVSLARLLAVDDLTAAADALMTGDLERPALVTADQLRRGAREAGSRRGVRDMRSALELARVGAWSRPETLLRLLIVRAGLPEPVLNAPLRLPRGTLVRPDLAWPDLRVAIEYDGSAFHGRSAWDTDAARHELLVDAGWTVVRVRADDLFRHRSDLVVRLQHRIEAAKAHSGVRG